MPRLGELLVDDEIITSDQLDHALAIQARLGLRVGSALIELGYTDGDTIARALSAQKGIPAVLEKHFAAMDGQAPKLLKPKQAEKYQAIPLGFTGSAPKRLVVVFIEPNPVAIEEIAFISGKRVEAGIAAEVVMKRQLARVYGIGNERPQMISVALKQTARASNRPKARVSERPKIRSLSAPPPPPSRPARQSTRAPSLASQAPPPPPPKKSVRPPKRSSIPPPARPALGVDEALAAMAAAKSSEAVADALVDHLRSAYGCGLVLLAKDEMALGWKGFAENVGGDVIESISIPLSAPSMLKVAHESQTIFRGVPPADGAALHKRLYKLLRCEPPREVVVAPVVLGRRVVNLVYAHAIGGGVLPAKSAADLMRVCAAVAESYTRIIRKK